MRGISARCGSESGLKYIGLNRQSAAEAVSSQMDFSIRCNFHSDAVEVYEGGTAKGAAVAYTDSDTLQIVINDAGAVEYFKNKIRFYTSQQTPEYPLHADVSVKAGSLTNVHWVERIASPAAAAAIAAAATAAAAAVAAATVTAAAAARKGGGGRSSSRGYRKSASNPQKAAKSRARLQ